MTVAMWINFRKRKIRKKARRITKVSVFEKKVVAKAAKLTVASSGASVGIQDEDEEILPPLSELPEDESDLE